MNTHVQVFPWTYVSIFLGCTPRIGIAGSHGNTTFNFLRNFQIVFQSNCIILRSHQECMRAPVSLHPPQRLLLSLLFIIAILASVLSFIVKKIEGFFFFLKFIELANTKLELFFFLSKYSVKHALCTALFVICSQIVYPLQQPGRKLLLPSLFVRACRGPAGPRMQHLRRHHNPGSERLPKCWALSASKDRGTYPKFHNWQSWDSNPGNLFQSPGP